MIIGYVQMSLLFDTSDRLWTAEASIDNSFRAVAHRYHPQTAVAAVFVELSEEIAKKFGRPHGKEPDAAVGP